MKTRKVEKGQTTRILRNYHKTQQANAEEQMKEGTKKK